MTTPHELVYAENWEDPRLEMQALQLRPGARVLAVVGGGCTVLSLLAHAPGQLDAVDNNPAQLQLLALKRAAVQALQPDQALGFLGGAPNVGRGAERGERHERQEQCGAVFEQLSGESRAYWGERRELVLGGVLEAGRSERFVALLRRLVWALVHPRRRVEELFVQADLAAQARFFRERWDTWRWRAVFALLRKRRLDSALREGAYAHVRPPNLGAELRERAARCLTTLPVAENYFLSRVLLGRYLPHPEGRPPYLSPEGVAAVRRNAGALALCPSDLGAWLAAQPSRHYDALYLSNVPEWLADAERVRLLSEVARVARPGARVVWRALMQERPLPAAVAERFLVDQALSERLGRADRAFMNAAFRVAEVRS